MASKEKTTIAGILLFVALIGSALYYYELRTIYSDMAFHTFSLVTEEKFAIMNFRVVAFLTQLFPLTAIHLSLPLSWILTSYSISFPIIGLFVWKYAHYVSQRPLLSLSIPLLYMTSVSASFYWCQSELQQGLIWMALSLIATDTLSQTTLSPLHVISWCLSLFFVAFSHPVLVIPMVFCHMYLGISNKGKGQWRWHLGALGLYGFFYFIKTFLFKNAYENEAFNAIFRLKQLFVENRWVLIKYAKIFTIEYLLSVGAWLYLFIKVIQEKVYFRLFFLFSFFCCYPLLIIGSFGATAEVAYVENQLWPWFFVPIYLVLFSIKEVNHKHLFIGLGIVILFYIVRITQHSHYFEVRQQAVRNLISQYEGKKIVLDDNKALRDSIECTWTLAYESWLLSEMKLGHTASLVSKENPTQLLEENHGTKVFLPIWGVYKYEDLPSKYFHFKDTTQSYQLWYYSSSSLNE